MKKIDPAYRANPDRSICAFGEFNDALINCLSPEILKLRALNNDPITVYINSNGGSTRVLDFLNGLLKSRIATGKCPRLITVATGFARSAAASLLSLGDYAISYPKAGIHFHGVRYMEIGDPVTMESASSMAAQLERANRVTASMLAEAATARLAFHYARSKSEHAEIRKQLDSKLSDIECFAYFLRGELSSNGRGIVDKAIERWKSLRELSDKVLVSARATGKESVEFESEVLKGIINFEVEKNKDSGWCLNAAGIGQVAKDYLLLRDYDVGKHAGLVKKMLERFSYAFFDEEEIKRIERAAESPPAELVDMTREKMRECIKPFCYFAASIWQSLHEDENPLTPKDAYWLGAVDEVYDSDLPCMREVMESDDDEDAAVPPPKLA